MTLGDLKRNCELYESVRESRPNPMTANKPACTCEIRLGIHDDNFGEPRIIKCPLCKAAPEMLADLKVARDTLSNLRFYEGLNNSAGLDSFICRLDKRIAQAEASDDEPA